MTGCLRLLLAVVFLALPSLPASAETMAGPGWASVSFETDDGEKVDVRAEGSAVSLKLQLQSCSGDLANLSVKGLPVLRNVGFFFDESDAGRIYILTIPVIKLAEQRQVHATASIFLRGCKVDRIEVEDDE